MTSLVSSSRVAQGVAGSGRLLAERLALHVVGQEGHDLKVPCVSCTSSDAGRVHQDTGVFHCYSCHEGLSAFQLALRILDDRQAARQAMIDAGLFEPDGTRPSHAGNGDSEPILLRTIAPKRG